MGMSRYTADGRRRSSMVHASHPHWCSCGRTFYGNGYAHHRRVNPDHRELTYSQYLDQSMDIDQLQQDGAQE